MEIDSILFFQFDIAASILQQIIDEKAYFKRKNHVLAMEEVLSIINYIADTVNDNDEFAKLYGSVEAYKNLFKICKVIAGSV